MAGNAGYAIARHADDNAIVAVRAGRPIRRAELRRDIAALASRLPAHRYILNLCTDRYRFMVGVAAALRRQQISLMPPSTAPGVLRALAEDYPDLYALTDTTPPPLTSFIYPGTFDDAGAAAEMEDVPRDQPALILFTSGSTGKPKPVPKTWSTLVHSARAAGDRLGLSRLRGGTVIATVPHQHSYGLESAILLGLQHGLTIDTGWPLYPADIRAALERTAGPRILVTTPVHLRALVAEPGGMPRADLILSATAPLPVSLAAQAEACFGAPLIEIYGCTEAGQVATRRTAQETQWQCFDGVALSQNEHGTWASGAAVEGVAPLQDVIELTGPGLFLLGGRSADLIDIAGKRTSLTHLNHQLQSIPGVEDGVFFMGEANGSHVSRLTALVVAPALRPETILQALRERIDPAFLPRPLIFTDALPRNELGKLPREALLRLAGRAQDA
ncbi:AMP-binding protein [Acidocella aquatica]|uniref:AMP-binding protein n=1 Tax=Acidocella aquatica TaxID=1922313 RepID=UPI0024E09414|nr:AMP-binding protein [Acidocella aquatica]